MVLLLRASVRRRVGAQEKARVAAGCCSKDGFAVRLSFENRLAVGMWVERGRKEQVPVVEQVLRRDGGREVLALAGHDEIHSFLCADVFQDDLEVRVGLDESGQLLLNESCLLVKNVDVLVNALAVNLQHKTMRGHGLECWLNGIEVRYACV